MTTRHLSVSAGSYPDGTWYITLLETILEPGKPARAVQLVTKQIQFEQLDLELGRFFSTVVRNVREDMRDPAR